MADMMPQVSGQPDKEVMLDGKPLALAARIMQWETSGKIARDNAINSFFGTRFVGSSTFHGGMKGLVIMAHRYFCPRQWELPPYLYTDADMQNNRDHLTYQWYFGNLMQQLPRCAPSDIKLQALPLSGDKKLFAAQANSILDEESEYLDMPDHIQKKAFNAKQFGSAVCYYGERPIMGPLNTDRIAEVCDPLAVIVDPSALTLEDSKWIIYKRWIRIDEAQRIYDPQFEIEEEEIDLDFSSLVLLAGKRKMDFHGRCVETIVWIKDSEQVNESIPISEDQPQVYLDGDGNPVADENGNPVVTMVPTVRNQDVEMFKYPHGRLVVLINKKMVKDEPNPYISKRCPFTKMDNLTYPGFFWGLPEWYVQGDMPHIINESFSAIVKAARHSFTKLVVEKESIDGAVEDITNSPDDPILVKPGAMAKNAVTTINMGGMAPQYAEALLNTLAVSDKVTGVNDPMRGNTNSSVTSGEQQRLLENAGSVRYQMFTSNLESDLEEAGIRILYNAIQFRPQSEVFTIASNADGTEQPFAIQDIPGDVEFKIKISPRSGLPTDREHRLEVLLKQIPAIIQLAATSPDMAEAVVKLSDIPEIQMAWDQMKQKMQMQQAAMQPQLEAQQNAQAETQYNGRPVGISQ